MFGRSSISGAVLFEPTRPQLDLTGGFADFKVGGMGLNQETAAINIPVVADHLAIRIAADRDHLDGYTQVQGTNDSLNETNNWAARVSLLWSRATGKFSEYALLDYVGVNELPRDGYSTADNPTLPEFNFLRTSTRPGDFAMERRFSGGLRPGGRRRHRVERQRLHKSAPADRCHLASGRASTIGAPPSRRQRGAQSDRRSGKCGHPSGGIPNQFFFVNQAQYDFGKIGFTRSRSKTSSA